MLLTQATEATVTGRDSNVTVIIPVAGDDHAPQLDEDSYDLKIVQVGDQWTLEPDTTFTATDEDKLVENKCDFTLLQFVQNFELTNTTETTTKIKLIDNFDLDSMPSSGQISIFIEVNTFRFYLFCISNSDVDLGC